jgi:hypothetical protein
MFLLFSLFLFILLFIYKTSHRIESFVNNSYLQSNTLLNKLGNLNAKWKNDLLEIQTKRDTLNKVFILPNKETPETVQTLGKSETKNTMSFLNAIIKKWPKIRGNQNYVMRQNSNTALTKENTMVPKQVSNDSTFKDIDFPTAVIPSAE